MMKPRYLKYILAYKLALQKINIELCASFTIYSINVFHRLIHCYIPHKINMCLSKLGGCCKQ